MEINSNDLVINPSYINPKYKIDLPEKPSDERLISYSQFSMFANCPLSWKLAYIDKLRSREASIHTVFGNAMHNTIQHWIQIMYNDTIKAANSIDLNAVLLHQMKFEYFKGLKHGELPLSKEELAEFYIDGVNILTYLKKKRTTYFTPRKEILIGTEVPIMIKKNGIWVTAYLDWVIQEKFDDTVVIRDIKTSTKGWGDFMKKDKVKSSQLLLYKLYFAKQYKVPLEKIRVEYLILKRKIDENSEWPQRRIQTFRPSQGKISSNQIQKQFDEFIKSCFLPDGTLNPIYEYKANPGMKYKNCRFCDFRDRDDLCPTKNRIPE